MTRVVVTARVWPRPDRAERWDCLDQALARLLLDAGFAPLVIPNAVTDAESWLHEARAEAIVLSGGNDLAGEHAVDTAPERDHLERQLLDYAARRDCPVLGICRGAQLMAVASGGRIERGEGHAGRRHPVHVTESRRFGWPESFEVNSFHGWLIPADGMAARHHIIATADPDSVEAFAHRDHRWLGVMWHPERDGVPRATTEALLTHLRG